MTHLVKFVKSSLTFAQNAIGTNRISNRIHKHTQRYFTAIAYGRTQHKFLSILTHCSEDHGYSNDSNRNKISMILGASFALFGFFEKEDPETALITIIKRSILLIQKEEFKKAEQMLHVALRQAQSLQNQDGITYVYDVMANLAFEVGEYDKAEKLFKSVMQRIIIKGTPKDDVKIIHMSLKMAKILEHKGDNTNAEIGYKYCLDVLQNHIDQGTEDIDIITLWAINLDWYSHLLLKLSRYTEAMKYMEKAYEMCVKLNGEVHEQSVVLLNDLGSISFIKGNLDDAIDYLTKAAEIGDKLPDMEDLSSIHVNLGNVYIKKGLLDEAKKACTKGWKLSNYKKNTELLEESNACLNEVNKLLIK